MGLVDAVTETIEPVVGALGVELVDVEHRGAVVRVVVDEAGGIGLDRLAAVTQAVSRALDAADPVPGRYTLEVSSPGLERPLRTPSHFARAVGQKVTVKTSPGYEGERRLTGVLVGADEGHVTLDAEAVGRVVVPLAAIERARTIFEWGPGPKPGKGSKPGATRRASASGAAGGRSRPDGERTAPGRRGGRAAGGGLPEPAPRETAVGEQLAGGRASVDDR